MSLMADDIENVITYPHIFGCVAKSDTDVIAYKSVAVACAKQALSIDGDVYLSSIDEARGRAIVQLPGQAASSDGNTAALMDFIALALPLCGDLKPGVDVVSS